jgi:pimeloyl-ACP methyl ester carboxylesterase
MSYADRFRTPEDAERYRAAYEATLALWPVPHEAMDVETSYGTTHINVAGSPDAPPLILISGAQISSTVWYPNVGPLSRHFRVYALDVVDQTGLSVPIRKLKTPQDSAGWLAELLDCLNLERVPMVGHSNGCWQILNIAKAAQERVERMVLLSPGPPFAALRWQLFLRLLPVFIRPTRKMFYWNLQWLTVTPLDADKPDTLIEQFVIGATAYRPEELGLTVINVFTDDEFRQIDIPALLLIGDHERVVDPERVLDRARRLMPNIEAELVGSAGHLMPVEQAEVVNERMLKFLRAE